MNFNSNQASDFSTDALMHVAERPPPVFVRGQGSWLWDREGRRYLDFVQGWAVNSLGHSPALIAETLAAQAATLISPGPGYWNAPSARLATQLVARSSLDRVFFASSGAEANEGAIKLARKFGARHRNGAFEIISFDQGFHGRTLATMSASGKPGWEALFAPKVPGFPKAKLNDLTSVEALIGEKTVAVMLEPIQGEAGVRPASDEFLRELRTLTRQRGLLLICDEVQTGMGRTGRLFAHEHAGIEPDVMTLGKGIGGGVPLAALLAREEVCCFEPGDQGGTYNGNPLMAAVGEAVLGAITAPGFLDEVIAKGERLAAALARLSARHGLGEVRGRGLLRALDLDGDFAFDLVRRARESGLLINAPRPNLLRLMPALTVTPDEIDELLSRLDALLAQVRGG
ncbi:MULTISPECIES: acetylornithine transaminase [Hydrocarboniphaga]|uniref:Acetylornithine aminotransferase n=1 Tax=Hydrocarboniphaga effusa AP103 TaxID=1172194 RepID=I7ZH19_9GAMM|nr:MULTISPECIES: acetylornithine transaminase [Hydrocarboniphaga]EIT71012.1 acetylornithine transaminase protein [Hydrocarboniphaga effusa AP103]MDZ4079078.1 acetylornithine transaminase [Hydrocarboniphaga sp.]